MKYANCWKGDLVENYQPLRQKREESGSFPILHARFFATGPALGQTHTIRPKRQALLSSIAQQPHSDCGIAPGCPWLCHAFRGIAEAKVTTKCYDNRI
jgi:hypothetical protein